MKRHSTMNTNNSAVFHENNTPSISNMSVLFGLMRSINPPPNVPAGQKYLQNTGSAYPANENPIGIASTNTIKTTHLKKDKTYVTFDFLIFQ